MTHDALRFVNDSYRNEIIPEKKRVRLSKIFKWFAKDFVLNFGTTKTFKKWTTDEMAVMSFVAYYLDDDERIAFLEEGKYKIKYLKFDWKLNKWQEE